MAVMEAAPVGTYISTKTEKDTYLAFVKDIYNDIFDGDKFPGSFGPTRDYRFVDYWTLRHRSMELFRRNPYAIGVMRRLVRNEIFTGLVPEASPIASIIWPDADPSERERWAVEFGESLTNNFNLYANDPMLFDYRKKQSFGEFQATIRQESLWCGDGIVISRINPKTGLPYWDWINGNHIRTPERYNPRNGNMIKHGIELDSHGRHVAYHVRHLTGDDYVSERIPCFGEKSGRRISWMIYGSEKLLDDVRGVPILACMLYMIKEVDRYRDAEARSALINAMIPLIVTRTASSGIGTRPAGNLERLQNPDLRQAGIETGPGSEIDKSNHPSRVNMEPGTIFDDLAPGEKIESFVTNRPNVNYRAFEDGIINVLCWVLEMPPEIGKLVFTSSYSAARQANGEFEIYIKYRTFKNVKDFCQFIYDETITQMILTGMVHIPGFVDAIITSAKWQIRNAWLAASWMGLSRPSIDLLKDVNAAEKSINLGIANFDYHARRIFGQSFNNVQQKLQREREMMRNHGFVSSIDEDQNGRPAYQQQIDEQALEEMVEACLERMNIGVNN